jgi:oligopeptide/dipeptide ABC transporter ATP-binding protein
LSEEIARKSKLLEVRGLVTRLRREGRDATVVDGVSFDLEQGESIGLVGESGSGKTMTALSILRLVPDPPGRIADGSILLEGRDLLAMPLPELQRVRGNEISMIFQEPAAALNPVFTVGDQIAEAVALHEDAGRKEAWARAVEILEKTGIPDPSRTARSYPHQLSGGMVQRAMIAMALVCRPSLLIADEPTSALDVTIQAQILELLGRLREEDEMGLLFISHDFGVVAGICDRVAVMYAGEIVETAGTDRLFAHPRHPYTAALFRSLPSLKTEGGRLEAVGGTVPSPFAHPSGCRFHPRCPHASDVCREAKPLLEEKAPGHRAACYFPL